MTHAFGLSAKEGSFIASIKMPIFKFVHKMLRSLNFSQTHQKTSHSAPTSVYVQAEAMEWPVQASTIH